MSELPLDLLFNAIIFILFPLIGGVIMTKLRLPRMIGYILSGMMLGLLTQGSSQQFLPVFANIGLILLMFTIGLETDLRHLQRFGKLLLSLGFFQMLLTIVTFYAMTAVLGMNILESFILAFAFSLSSTAIVSKVIQDKSEENSLIGSMTLGMLILQDLMVIPFMIFLSSVGKATSGVDIFIDIVVTTGKTGVILGIMFFFGQKLAPFVFAKTAILSRELLNLLTLLCVALAVFIFTFLGLSPAIAAFVAGTIIGGTMEHYQIFSQMRPLRDIFTILFFVILGASIDITQLFTQLPSAFLFVVVAMLLKFIIVSSLFTYFRFHSRTAFAGGILLSQVGEFAFVVLQQSHGMSIIRSDVYYFGITATLITIALSPMFMERKDKLYHAMRKFIRKYVPAMDHYISHQVDSEPAHIDVLHLKNHVVICGYGRVGGYIGRALTMANIPFIAIDYDYRTVAENKKKGINIIYGDPTDMDILDFAETEKAAMLVSAVPDEFSQETIVLNSKILNPKITILSRVAVEEHRQRIKDLGAEIVVQPEFEAALSIVKKVLIGFKVPKKDIIGKVKRLKLEHGMA